MEDDFCVSEKIKEWLDWRIFVGLIGVWLFLGYWNWSSADDDIWFQLFREQIAYISLDNLNSWGLILIVVFLMGLSTSYSEDKVTNQSLKKYFWAMQGVGVVWIAYFEFIMVLDYGFRYYHGQRLLLENPNMILLNEFSGERLLLSVAIEFAYLLIILGVSGCLGILSRHNQRIAAAFFGICILTGNFLLGKSYSPWNFLMGEESLPIFFIKVALVYGALVAIACGLIYRNEERDDDPFYRKVNSYLIWIAAFLFVFDYQGATAQSVRKEPCDPPIQISYFSEEVKEQAIVRERLLSIHEPDWVNYTITVAETDDFYLQYKEQSIWVNGIEISHLLERDIVIDENKDIPSDEKGNLIEVMPTEKEQVVLLSVSSHHLVNPFTYGDSKPLSFPVDEVWEYGEEGYIYLVLPKGMTRYSYLWAEE